MISRNEWLAYFGITLSLFLIASIPAFISDNPDLSVPDRKETITTTSSESSTTTTRTSITTRSVPPPPDNPIPNILFILMGVIGVIFLFLIITRVRRYSAVSAREKSDKIKSEAEGVFKLINSRDEAHKILKHSLETGSYTDSFIEAYQVLDKNLDYFREVARPKHITPREYAFSVREPIFRPSVYKFVKIFYDLRYGSRQAAMEDIQIFISALEYLFVDEIPGEEIVNLNKNFENEILDFKDFKIPDYFDPSKPKGGTL
jgi:hypothetical protein